MNDEPETSLPAGSPGPTAPRSDPVPADPGPQDTFDLPPADAAAPGAGYGPPADALAGSDLASGDPAVGYGPPAGPDSGSGDPAVGYGYGPPAGSDPASGDPAVGHGYGPAVGGSGAGDVPPGSPPPPTGGSPGPGPGPGAGAGSPPPYGPGPYGAPVPPPRRLVRDPYSRLGGVASGIAHHYGIDVSLVRLLFVVLTFASGAGLLAYLVAWLIIPRAEYWPPPGPARPIRSLSNRDLGIGLAVVGVLIAVALGGHGTAFLVPLVLVAGGVWLLIQPSADPAPAATATGAGTTAFSPTPPAPSPAGPGSWPGDLPPAPTGAYQAGDPYQTYGAPVPPRSRRRRFGIFTGVLGLLLLLLAIPLIALIAFIAAVASGSDGFHTSTIRLAPDTVSQLPGDIREDGADLTIDLTSLRHSDFATQATPPVIKARVDAGRIEIIVPPDVNPSVQAESQLGQVVVFDQTDDGIRAEIDRNVTNPDLILQLDVGAGEVLVHRG